jgi:hypothetical protein
MTAAMPAPMNGAVISPALQTSVNPDEELPRSVELRLTVDEPSMVAQLCTVPEGRAQHDLAVAALRIGLLALDQARGRIDADIVASEGRRLLERLGDLLEASTRETQTRITATLREYFDPQSGRFEERVQRLVRRDGELEEVLKRHVGGPDSEIARTLATLVGRESELVRRLDPSSADGVLKALADTLDEQLRAQRERVLAEFSLDNPQGALARMLGELAQRHGALEGRIEERIADVVREFSLDDDGSALSRLVRAVERAQKTITAEFSLDSETSALSRMAKQLDRTARTLEAHLTLDDDASALSRLRRELITVLQSTDESNRRFQEEVKVAIRDLTARREEAARSTTHGFTFQDAVYAAIERLARNRTDMAEDVASCPGAIARCKKGDAVVTLGAEHVAAGARIVVESKDDGGYTVARALEEMQQARKNREASLGLFVLSASAAPDGTPGFARHGDDVIVVWDPEDPATDVRLEAGFEVCRSLAARRAREISAQGADLAAIDQAILGVERCLGGMDDIATWARTVESNGQKILKRVQADRDALAAQVVSLRDHTAALRASLAGEAP